MTLGSKKPLLVDAVVDFKGVEVVVEGS